MLDNITVNTGPQRSVTGHFVSGTIFFGVLSGGVNYAKYNKNQITKNELIKDTLKTAFQGGIATSSAIAAANYIGKGNLMGTLGATAIGALGVYATQKAYDKLEVEATKTKEISNAK